MYRSDYENEGTVKIRNEGKVADENWKSLSGNNKFLTQMGIDLFYH